MKWLKVEAKIRMVVIYSYFDSEINIVCDFDIPLYYSINMKSMINRIDMNTDFFIFLTLIYCRSILD